MKARPDPIWGILLKINIWGILLKIKSFVVYMIAITFLYMFSYLFIYRMLFIPFGTLFGEGVYNIFIYVGYAYIPAFLMWGFTKYSIFVNKVKGSVWLVFINFILSIFYIILIEGVIEGTVNGNNSGHNEFQLFYILPSLFFYLLVSFLSVKWVKSLKNKESL